MIDFGSSLFCCTCWATAETNNDDQWESVHCSLSTWMLTCQIRSVHGKPFCCVDEKSPLIWLAVSSLAFQDCHPLYKKDTRDIIATIFLSRVCKPGILSQLFLLKDGFLHLLCVEETCSFAGGLYILLRDFNFSSVLKCLTNSAITPISYGWLQETRWALIDSLCGSKCLTVTRVLVFSVIGSKRGSSF